MHIISFLALLHLHFASFTSALLACDAAGCPFENGFTRCSIANATLSHVGIANISNPFGPEPLTWTLGEQSFNSDKDARLDQYFFLGTPASFKSQLDRGPSFSACALFFKDAADRTSFLTYSQRSAGNVSDTAYYAAPKDNGTCPDALGGDCLDALRAQALSILANPASSNTTSGNTCQSLAASLQRAVIPKPCASLSKGNSSWGEVIGTSLLSSGTPIPPGECHPTTGRSYDLNLALSIQRGATTSDFFHSGYQGVTPLVTMFLPTNTRGAAPPPASGGNWPVVDVTCMAPVYLQRKSNAWSGKASSRIGWLLAVVVGTWLGFG